MAVPFTPKGHIDLPDAVRRAAQARFPELFGHEAMLDVMRLTELKGKRHTVRPGRMRVPGSILSSVGLRVKPLAPEQNIYPSMLAMAFEEEREYVELVRRKEERATARCKVEAELRQVLGDGELGSFVIREGRIEPISLRFWRSPLSIEWLRRSVMPDQLDQNGDVAWGVLIPLEPFNRWLEGPAPARTRRKNVSEKLLLERLEAFCIADIARTGVPTKRDAAVAWLQAETGCDRPTAQRVHQQLQPHLRRRVGKPATKPGKENRQ